MRRSGLLPILMVTALFVGCNQNQSPLEIDDLNAGERVFLERYVVLERARAVVLADPVLGVALLDSLAAAWGDSAAVEAEERAEIEEEIRLDPERAALLQNLITRVLTAESDSLIHAPRPDRLDDPLPQPAPPDQTD